MRGPTVERNRFLDHAKAYACLLVLVGHVLLGLENAGVPLPLCFPPLISFLWTLHIPLFLFLNGQVYRMGGTHQKKGKVRFLAEKAANLLIPYFVFSSLYGVINATVGGTNTANSFSDLLFLWKTPVAQYWYLYALFFVFLLWVLLDFIAAPLRLILLLAAGYLIPLFGVDLGIVSTALYSSLPFALGAMLGEWDLKKIPLWQKGLYFLVHLLLAFFCISYGFHETAGVKEGLELLGIAGSLLFISLLSELPLADRVLSFVCRHSFSIYLLHTIFTAGVRIVLTRLSVTSVWIHLPVGLLVGLVFPVLFSLLAEKIPLLEQK